MSLDKLRAFDDGEKLRDIRSDVLNPLSLYVKNVVVKDVKDTKEDVKKTYKDIKFDPTAKKFTLSKSDPTAMAEEIDIGSVIPPEFEGIEIHGGTGGGSSTKVKEVTFEHALVTGGQDAVHVDFDWDYVVPEHQEYPMVQIGSNPLQKIKQLKFTGNEDKVSLSGSILNFEIPKDPTEFTAKVDDGSGSGVEKIIKKIIVEGNTTGSEVTDDGELKIKVPVPGAGGAGGNFQGFFNSLGDIISEVTNPINGRSYAFAKDDKTKGKYYTPYMYVANNWTEAPVDPAITFEPAGTTGPQGVFSIKPDTRIKLDSKGQLDLGLLGEGHFVGFFDSQSELEQACPHPYVDKSFAYIKTTATGVYSGMKYSLKNDGSKAWVQVTPYGLISAVEKNQDDTIKSAMPVFGIEKNDAITVDSGVITIKPQEEQSISITANVYPSGIEETEQVTQIKFIDGVYVEFDKAEKAALIRHPHKVIHYGDDFEKKHQSVSFLGNIYFDADTNKWMGYTPSPNTGDPKWTYLAHRGMSDDVKSLSGRYPVKAPSVIPGQQSQDHAHWGHNGVTYVASATDAGMDSAYKDIGIYIETIVQDTPSDDLLSPKNRIQVGFTEANNSEIFIRFSDPQATFPSNPWKDWVKTSVSPQDIVDHNNDPDAHKETNRFYKIYTLKGLYKDVKAASGYIYDRTTHAIPVADNRGIDSSSHGYFKLPYPGGFKFRGRFEIDNTAVGQDTWLKGAWVARIYKVKTNDQKVLLQSFLYEHEYSNKPYPGFSFSSNHFVFEKGESVLFYLDFQQQSSTGGQFIDRAKFANFMAWRSYLVLEDASTDAGDRLAESYRLTHGMFYSNGDSSVNTHPANLDNPSSWPRVYGKVIDTKTTGMVST